MCLSVRLSVRHSVLLHNLNKITSPTENPKTLVFASQVRHEIRTCLSRVRRKMRVMFTQKWTISFKAAVSPKRCNIKPRLLMLLITRTRFRLVAKSMAIDDPELTLNGHYGLSKRTLLHYTLCTGISKLFRQFRLVLKSSNLQ